MHAASLQHLRSDARAATALEFALVAPVFLTMVMGLVDIGHTAYVKTLLNGEIARAARSSSLESAPGVLTSIDDRVKAQIANLAPNATVAISRKSYRNYSNLKVLAEPYTETNGNSTCNAGEIFEDLNNNGTWDQDSGKVNSLGGANDIILYTVTVTYPRITPTMTMITGQSNQVLSVTTQLRNQPYGASAAVVTRACP
jgi:Flp pilus assembly protein TadG